MFWFVIAEKSSDEFVIEVLTPVSCEFETRMGTSTLWSAVRCSPFAWRLSLQNVAIAASAFSMMLRATLAVTFDVIAASLARSW